MPKFLKSEEGYKAMVLFLDEVYDRAPSEELGALLSGMQLNEDGTSMDPAFIEDWERCVDKVLDTDSSTSFSETGY